MPHQHRILAFGAAGPIAGLGDLLGEPVAARRVDPATLGRDADPLRPMFAHYDRHGLHGNPLTLEMLLGRAPRTLRSYFAELRRDQQARS